MATLEENINQAISDFNDIELALEEQGVNVPSGTDTSEYGNLVRSISNNGTVDQTYNPTSVNAQSGIAVAEAMSELPITLVESPDTNGNILDIYSMDSGTYIFSGKFTPYPEASTTFSFSSGQLVTIRHGSISTVAQVFYPPNNAIQYLDIRPDETSETGYTYTRQDAKLVNMESITNRVTTLDEDCDDEHYPTAKAVYDQLNELNKIATTDIDGLLSASDKSKLDGIEEGANKTVVDSGLSDTSTNPVQNKVVSEKIKNHASFSVLTTDSNEKTYIKLGKFTGDGVGGRAIFTINGKVGWNNKNDGGLKVLTLSSNDSRDTTSTDIFTGGSFFDFGHSDNDGTSIIEDTPDIQIALVRPSGYSVKEVDVYLKFVKNKYNSYLFTVDFTDGCKWETDIKSILTTDPDPMETALSSYIVPKKRFGGIEEGATKTIVDTTLSPTSTNPIQNKAVAEQFDILTNKFIEIEDELDSKVSSVNGKNGTVTVTGADIPLEEGSQTLIAPYINSINSSVLQMNEKINRDLKNHASFLARRVTANTVYINLGKFTGDNGGGKAIITISGNPYWGGKGDGGFRVLTLSSNVYSDISSTDIHTGASLYDFGQSNYTGTEIVDDQYNIQVALVRPNGYSVAEVDVYLKFNNYQYNSYFVTVDYSDGCSWVTSTEKVTASDPDPMENALSAFIVPKRQIADLTKLETKADVETGNCTLTVSNGTVSNASYSKTGKDVTVNFWFYPADTNEVVVSGLPYVATKNQSGIASASVGGVRVSYEMSKDNANATLYPETTSEQYCTLTYNLGAYNPQP